MQSDPQDELGPVAGGNEAVEPGPSSGPGASSPQDTGPQYPMAGGRPAPSGPASVQPPQMPAEPSGYVAPPQMPGQPAPSWDGGTDPLSGQPESTSPSAQPEHGSSPDIPATPAPGTTASAAAAGGATAPVHVDDAAADDWVGRICPYLLSEDGSYRSTQPDEGHRCTAQEPKGTLPLAFQERYCLTDKHVRCEMYKYALENRAATPDGGDVPPPQAGTTGRDPAVGTVSAAYGGSGRGAGVSGGSSGGDSRRPAIIAIVAIGLLILLVVVTLALSGGGSDGPGAGASTSPDVAATSAPATEAPTPEPELTPQPQDTPEPEAPTEPTDAAASGRQDIDYQVQEGEGLLKIAENFGTTRQRIIRANDGMADKQPYVEPGDIIIVPAAAALTVEELEAFPGYLGPAE